MKRDMELIRKMILYIEDSPNGWAPSEIKIDGYSAEEIGYHAYLLVDAGLATGADITNTQSSGPEYLITHLTSAGHDFADASRDEGIWKKARGIVKEKAGSVTIDIMKQILTWVVKKAVGLG
jgi:hypothetical protein